LNPPIIQDAANLQRRWLRIRVGLEKEWKLFWPNLAGFHSWPAAEFPSQFNADGLCFLIVTISTGVCNKSSPAFGCANFQAGIFSGSDMDSRVLLNCRVWIWKTQMIAEK
jgi:hypothetical protein